MQGGGGRDPFGGRFGGFGGGSFGGFGLGGPNNGPPNLMSSFFGGRDPFDDPFFTQPFGGVGGGMFHSNFFGSNMNPFAEMRRPPGYIDNNQLPGPSRSSRGPVIEEIDSDDEKEGKEEEEEEGKEKKGSLGKHNRSSSDADTAEYARVEAEERRNRELLYMNANAVRRNSQMQNMNVSGMLHSGIQQPQTRSYSFHSSTVTYGGQNGNYYTSSKTRRTGSDGLTLEESREANTATREAAHRISRGLHNKGHTVARKLNSDGRVDTTQTLHNLNEDELANFEQSWNGNARRQMLLPSRSGSFGSGPVNREQQMLLPPADPSSSHAQTEPSRRTKAAMKVRGHGRN